MRILITILFLITFTLPSFGIWHRLWHSDSIDPNLRTDSIVTVYLSDGQWAKVKSKYNKNGKKIREFFYMHNPSNLTEENEFIYDINNKLIKSVEIRGEKPNTVVYKYDTRGNKVAEYHNKYYNEWYYGTSKGKKYSYKRKWKYNYDAKGNVIEMIDKYHKDKYVYMYNAKGEILKEIYWSKWECKKMESFYNIYGKKEKSVLYKCNPNKKDIDTVSINIYTYDEFLNLTQIDYQSFGKEEWNWGMKMDFVYDNNGKKKEKMIYLWDSDIKDWRKYKTLYTYDNNGNLLEETRYSIWSKTEEMQSYPITEQIIYVYNEKGKMITRSRIIYSQDNKTKEWILSGKEEYEIKDNTAVEKYYNFDVETNEWFENPYQTDTHYFSVEK